ncbi:MAG: mevalonate kinase [Phototrophicaceae bacterium]
MNQASAPAKIILFGEHAVVYGQPAIAVPVSALRASAQVTPAAAGSGLRIEAADVDAVLPVELDSDAIDNALAVTARMVLRQLDAKPPDAIIRLTSTIPMASGLGSGAAVSAAVARAVCAAVDQPVADAQLNAIVYEIEKMYHGTPSGIDNTVIVYEQPVYFVRGKPIKTLHIGQPLTFIIGDTGQSALTKITVGDVRRLYEQDPERIQPVLDAIGTIVRQARQAIAGGDTAALGPLMQANHAHLRTLTVSSPQLDQLVQAALDAGAVGAKLSGGGRGGNMIALVADPSQAQAVADALRQAGAVRTIITHVG